jgi:tetratricopeptide (TPR) repeat protein
LIRKASDLERLGSPDSALETTSEAKHAATDAGYSKGVGISLLIGGNVLYNKGDYPAARALFENALSIFQDTGDKRNQGMALEGIGNAYHDQGKFAESQNEYTRALEAYREVQWPTGVSSATGNLANTLDSLGDPKGSLGMHQEALRVFEQIGNKRAIASEVNNIAVVQQETGNLQAAADGHRKSIALHRQTGYQTGEMYGLSGLGDVLLVQGNFDAARKQYELARTLGGKIQEADQSARSDIQIATIDLLQDRFSEAEVRLRRSATQFEQGKDPEGSALAYAELTKVLLAEKKNAEAIEAGRQAKNYAGQITSLSPQFEVDLGLADLEAATGEKDKARKRLLASLDRARRGGYTQYVLEARRELIGLETGKMREAHLSALTEESRQKGFGLLVTEIARMPKSSTANPQVAER